MATLNVAGGRRSSAPTYSPRATLTSRAVNMPVVDDAVVQQLMQAFNAPSIPGLQQGSGGGNYGAAQAQAGTPGSLGQVAGAANMLGAMANLTQNPDMAQMANALGKTLGVVGLGANLANAQSLSDVGKAVVSSPTALSAMGLPGMAASGIAGFATGGVGKATENVAKGLAYSAFAPLGVVDAALSLAGVPTIADRVIAEVQLAMQAVNPEDVSVIDKSLAETSLSEGDFSDYGFSQAPDFSEGGWQSGDLGNGVTVGGPMSPGTISGTDLGTFGGGNGYGGNSPGPGGGYGVGSGSDADRGGGFSSGTSGMGD